MVLKTPSQHADYCEHLNAFQLPHHYDQILHQAAFWMATPSKFQTQQKFFSAHPNSSQTFWIYQLLWWNTTMGLPTNPCWITPVDPYGLSATIFHLLLNSNHNSQSGHSKLSPILKPQNSSHFLSFIWEDNTPFNIQECWCLPIVIFHGILPYYPPNPNYKFYFILHLFIFLLSSEKNVFSFP